MHICMNVNSKLIGDLATCIPILGPIYIYSYNVFLFGMNAQVLLNQNEQ